MNPKDLVMNSVDSSWMVIILLVCVFVFGSVQSESTAIAVQAVEPKETECDQYCDKMIFCDEMGEQERDGCVFDCSDDLPEEMDCILENECSELDECYEGYWLDRCYEFATTFFDECPDSDVLEMNETEVMIHCVETPDEWECLLECWENEFGFCEEWNECFEVHCEAPQTDDEDDDEDDDENDDDEQDESPDFENDEGGCRTG